MDKKPIFYIKDIGGFTTLKIRKELTKDQCRFFELLYEGMSGAIAFQNASGKRLFTKLPEIDKAINFVNAEAEDVWIAPYTFATHSTEERYAMHARAIWLDFDDTFDLEDIYEIIEKRELPTPNIIVWSGSARSFHVYWVMDKPTTNVHLFVRQLASLLGADGKATNKSRVMRVPGTTNQKTGAKSAIVHFNEHRYDTSELYDTLNDVLDTCFRPNYIPVLQKERKVERFNTKREIFEYVSSAIINKGERNAAIGVLVQYLEEQHKSQVEILDFVRKVNEANFRPRCRDRELVKMVGGWHQRYDERYCLTSGYIKNHLSSLQYEHEHIRIVSKKQTVRLAASLVKNYVKELNGNDLYILFIVRRYGAMSVTQLIDRVHLARRTVFYAVNRLKETGVLIEERGVVRVQEHHNTRQYVEIDSLCLKLFETKTITQAEFKLMCVLKFMDGLQKVTQKQIARVSGGEDMRAIQRILNKLEGNDLLTRQILKRVNVYTLHF